MWVAGGRYKAGVDARLAWITGKDGKRACSKSISEETEVTLTWTPPNNVTYAFQLFKVTSLQLPGTEEEEEEFNVSSLNTVTVFVWLIVSM